MKKLGYVVALACLLAGANGAFGGLATVGNPIEIDSWTQGFNESGVGSFDQMVIQIKLGGPFEASAFRNLATDWTTTDNITQTAAWASGPDSTNMTFNIAFQGSSADALTFKFWALDGIIVREGALAVWNGSGWVFSGLDPSDVPPSSDPGPLKTTDTPVPEPITMASAFFAIAGLGGYIRRRTGRAAA